MLQIKKIIDRACREKTKLIEVQDTKNIACEEVDIPEQFYSFRYRDKGLCITKTKYGYDENVKRWHRYSKDFYCIEVYGYLPSKLVTSNEYYYSFTRKYGCYDNLQEAKNHYRDFLIDFMTNQLNYTIHEHMELFTK